MLMSLIKNWWAVGLVGVLAILLGVMAFTMPGITLGSLVMAYGAYALVSGVCLIVAGASGEDLAPTTSRGWVVVTGVLGILAGLTTLFWPGITAVALYAVIATWAILAGITQAIAAIIHRHEIEHTWIVALGGVATAIFGAYLLATPAGVLALAYALGIYAVTYGIIMLVASFQLKNANDAVKVTVTRMEQPAELTEEERTRR